MCNALTVTKRESAPLPERLCERITCSTILLTVYEADYSVVVAQSEGADHRYYSTPEMQNILLQNVVGHVVRKAKNFAGGATDAIFSGRQPFGSIPRCCNSLRSIRLIQVANEVSPSALAASSSCALNSSGSRIWYGGDRFSNGVDMVITLNYYSYMVITIVLTITQKTTPRSAGTHAGRLTTNDSRSIEVAMRNHTTHPQGRDSHNLNKYIWRFIALSTAQPRVIHIEATSEQEARQQSPAGCVMVFAARIRQEVHHA
ncbi:host cell division inhibitor Icd-like protein [Escherichia sp. E3659]|uniref:host cell division inhibitor Icd-like protein n=1 Tax=Escherichia sp. E3659 TaxID=2044462 RepID=UPI0010FEE051|nr:host cell division inhibitor Icd-like protein [Escherichia sp. E3659]TLJ09799.1 host cell division inhibitor Icd-like protein [Escherichia sp. E3659]